MVEFWTSLNFLLVRRAFAVHLRSQEAVNFVRLRLSENPDLASAAKELTKRALDEGSVDNVSVVLVWFQHSNSSTEVSSAEAPPSDCGKCESLRYE